MSHREERFHLGVKALIFNEQGKLLLLRLNNKLKDVEGGWDIPGGRVQQQESIENALQRELYEELGLKNILSVCPFKMVLSPLRIQTADGDVGLVLATYICFMGADSQICLSEVHTGFEWVELHQVKALLTPNFPLELLKAIDQIDKESILNKSCLHHV